jgi:threonyl-tRNA synthetase
MLLRRLVRRSLNFGTLIVLLKEIVPWSYFPSKMPKEKRYKIIHHRKTFWHSSAHLLGATLESLYGCNLCIGPPLENGFFYDSYMGDAKVTTGDYEKIEKAYQKIASEKAPFQRIVLTKQQA